MEQMSMVLEPVRVFMVELGHFLPRLLLALAILVAGWLVAKGLKLGADKALRAINFNVLTEKAGVDAALRQGGVSLDMTAIIGVLVYWAIVLTTLVVAFNTLGLTQVTDLLQQILLFLPKVIVGLLLLVIGAYFARFVATSIEAYCRNVGIADGAVLGQLAFYAIMVFVVLTALEQLNLTGELLRSSFLIILAGVVLALALAFGLGGQKAAADMLERWRAQREGGGGKPGG
jgi:hypothetical protein